MIRWCIAFIPFWLLVACSTDPSHIPGAFDRVTRNEAIQIAQTYQQLKWQASKRNRLHGPDADGIQVHTPDTDLAKHGYKGGWWQTGQEMTGVPYQWGGFDTPTEFLSSLKRGEAAGDIATSNKRRLDDAATSRHACGIDCSGFISRCWRLKRHYSTDEMHLICKPLPSAAHLKAGDIMLNDGHVLMFYKWDPYRQAHMIVYESTPNPTWRVNIGSIPLERLEKDGYRPWRYRRIED